MSVKRLSTVERANWSVAPPGLVRVVPTSISFTGTSASVSATGQVIFSNVTALGLDGIFSALYDDYMIVMRHHLTSGALQNIAARLKNSGGESATTVYTRQYVFVTGASYGNARSAHTEAYVGLSSSTGRSGDIIHIYRPFLAEYTTFRNVNTCAESGGYIGDNVNTHALTTSYTGLNLTSTAFNGALVVYGRRK